jgi:hypothetical protein
MPYLSKEGLGPRSPCKEPFLKSGPCGSLPGAARCEADPARRSTAGEGDQQSAQCTDDMWQPATAMVSQSGAYKQAVGLEKVALLVAGER